MKKITKNLFSLVKKFRWLLITAVIVITLVGIGIYRQAHKQVKYTMDKVIRTTVVDLVSESGNIQAESQAVVNSVVDGIVSEIYVKNNDYVNAGQALFAVKSAATEQEIAAAYSAYLNAQNNVKLAEQNKNALIPQIRTAKKQLIDATALYIKISKSISTDPATVYTQTDLASAKLAYSAAKVNVGNLNNNYDKADIAIDAARQAEEAARLSYEAKNIFIVKAPVAGFVSNLAISVGDRVGVNGGLQTNTVATPNLIIADVRNLVFKAQFNEIDIPKIKIGQKGEIIIDALKDEKIAGQVKKIDAIGANTQGVISYNVYLSINNPDPVIKIGMSGDINIETEKHENVLTVSSAAIKPYQDGKAVQVVDPSRPKKNNTPVLKYIPVKTGIKTSDRTEILEGLSEGEEVVINNTTNQFKSNLFGG